MGIDVTPIFVLALTAFGGCVGGLISLLAGLAFGSGLWQFGPPIAGGIVGYVWMTRQGA